MASVRSRDRGAHGGASRASARCGAAVGRGNSRQEKPIPAPPASVAEHDRQRIRRMEVRAARGRIAEPELEVSRAAGRDPGVSARGEVCIWLATPFCAWITSSLWSAPPTQPTPLQNGTPGSMAIVPWKKSPFAVAGDRLQMRSRLFAVKLDRPIPEIAATDDRSLLTAFSPCSSRSRVCVGALHRGSTRLRPVQPCTRR